MKIAILSIHSGVSERGVENWATELKRRLNNEVEIVSGNYLVKLSSWCNADIVVPTNGRLQSLFVKLISVFFRFKIIIFGHSGPGADDKLNLYCSPHIFVAFSDAQKRWAEKYKLPWTKIVKINHAVDTKIFKPAVNKPKNAVICAAADSPDKRVDLVRKAVKQLKGVKLLVAGKGQENELSYEQMPHFYKRGSVFCFVPQSWEAFGLVYLEALATNLPVVANDDPIRKEIVGNAGILVKDPENIDELSKAIKISLDKKWGNIPHKQAEKFSWDKILPQYTKLFNNL